MRTKHQRSPVAAERWWMDRSLWLSVATIIVMTLLTFQPMFDPNKEFVNWDDDDYITEQPLVRDLSNASVTKMFDTKSTVSANYHPLTMLSLALDVDRGGMAMRPIMQMNLLLHVVNAVLVFMLIYMLLQRNVLIAFTVALLFAVHPMHVESVVWAAARKDVLYTLWFMAAAIAYLGYVHTAQRNLYAVSVGCFALACLSKPMAVTLPVLLLAVDMYLGRLRQGIGRVLAEKLPFVALSVTFGLLTFSIQSSDTSGLVDTSTYTFLDRLVFAGYGIMQYVIKLVVPTHLSAFYPYPSELQPGYVPGLMIAGAIAVVAVLAGIITAWRRWRTPTWNLIAFGVAFYLITASLVLQVISVGGASMADRYTYVPYIGLCIIVGIAVQRLAQTAGTTLAPLLVVTLLGGACAWLSHDRIGVWKNSETLWTDVIGQFPYEFTPSNGKQIVSKRGALYAYSNRGIHYIRTGQHDKAIADLGVLSRAAVKHPDSYRAYGVALQMRSRHAEAITAFTTAMQQGDQDYQIYRARGASYLLSGKPDAAIADFMVTLRKQPADQLTINAMREAQALKLAQTVR